jgi:hypothetical protein
MDNKILPLGGVRSYGRLGVGRPPKIYLNDVESNKGGGGLRNAITRTTQHLLLGLE